MVRNPGHDVWMTILALIYDTNTLKICNLVCTKWHLRLQARLFSSITFDGRNDRLTTEVIQILQPLRHCVRRLSVENWNATVPRPEHDLPPLGVFRGLKELTLYCVSFARLAELRDYLSGVAAPLDSFQLTECVAIDQDDMFAMIYPSRSGGHGHAFESHHIALRELELIPVTDDTFDAVLLRWLALSPALKTLRTLVVSVMHQESAILESLTSLVANPACELEELELIFWERSSIGRHVEPSTSVI
jgi:hypothetical protein